jgi:hypothetical protein
VKDARGLLILLAVVVVVAGVFYLVTRPKPEAATPAIGDEPVRFRADDVPLTSDDLAVTMKSVRAAVHADYTSWLVLLTCDEPEGCAGELEAMLRVHGGGSERRLTMVGRVDVPAGGELRFEGMEDVASVVDRVDRVTLVVRERAPRGAPTPGVID